MMNKLWLLFGAIENINSTIFEKSRSRLGIVHTTILMLDIIINIDDIPNRGHNKFK